jgi:hypothetical protein
MDRAHIGEFVYGHIYRGNSETEDFMFHPEKYIDISDTYLVMLTDSPENVLSREDGESLSTSISDIQKEKERFIQGFKRSTILNKLHIDWAEFNSDVNFEQKKQLYYKQLSFFLSV